MKIHQCPHKDCGKAFPRLYNLKRHLVLIHEAELATPLASLNKASSGRESKRLNRVVDTLKLDMMYDADCITDADATFGDTNTGGLNNNEKSLTMDYTPTVNNQPVLPLMSTTPSMYSMISPAHASKPIPAQPVTNNQHFTNLDVTRRETLKKRVANLERVVQNMTQEAISIHHSQMQQLNSINVLLFQVLAEL